MASDPIKRDSAASIPRKRGLLRFPISLVAACTAILILFTVGGFFARQSWRLEQLCHFRVQFFWLLAAAAVVLVAAGRRRLAFAAVCAAVVNGVLIAPIYFPPERTTPMGGCLRLIAFNVLGSNRRHDDVLDFLRREDADVVLLMEVQPHWAERIETLSDLYPHRHVIPRRDNFGIALLSKTPWRAVETQEFGSAEVPTIVATFGLGGRQWLFVGTHPVPPGSSQAAAARNEHLALIGQFVGQQPLPAIVAGDLNLTNYSPYFGDLLQTGGLRDSRQGFGVQASWAPRLPLLDLPLDHFLTMRHWHVANRRVGPHLGSDHRPVIADLHWDQQAADATE